MLSLKTGLGFLHTTRTRIACRDNAVQLNLVEEPTMPQHTLHGLAALVYCVFVMSVGCTRSETGSGGTSQLEISEETSQLAVESLENDDHHYFHKEEKPHAAEWSYKGSTGPANWASLSPAYLVAKTGSRQSPIDIHDAQPQALPAIEFLYHPAKIDLVYNGHTVQDTEEQGSSIKNGKRSFELKQFHFHSPSEHTLGGKHTAMEMHLVHKDEVNRVAVVGVMIQEGEHNPAFDSIWDYLPSEANKQVEFEQTVDATNLLPEKHDYFHYMGSFTTPPCTEGVHWYVLTSPIEMSMEQIAKFRSIIDNNNRPVQALNDRVIADSKSN